MRATEALVGASRRDGQPRHVEIVDAGGVAAGDPRIVARGRLGLFVVRRALEDLRQRSCAIGEMSTRCAGSPSPTSCCPKSCSRADDVAQADADGVLLEA